MSTINVADRPFTVTFPASGNWYPLTSDDVRRLAESYPVVRVTAGRLVLRADDGQRVTIVPASLGGGPAFTRVR